MPSVKPSKTEAATDPLTGTVTAVGSTVEASPGDAPSPSRSVILGQLVMVKLAPGSTLINGESGGFFAPDTPTPQTVTVTLLRRLQDGDLVLC